MEIILYITGGIALLALTWLLVTLVGTMKTVNRVLVESQAIVVDARKDLTRITNDITEIKTEVLPILANVSDITSQASDLMQSVQKQLVAVQDTIDDTLDVVRGTIDDVERIKNNVVATVEAPLELVRFSSEGTIGAIRKGISLIAGIVGSARRAKNGQAKPDHSSTNIPGEELG